MSKAALFVEEVALWMARILFVMVMMVGFIVTSRAIIFLMGLPL